MPGKAPLVLLIMMLNGVTSNNIGEEIDVVYTHFFTPGNHVAWQIGGGVFLPGARLDQAAMVG